MKNKKIIPSFAYGTEDLYGLQSPRLTGPTTPEEAIAKQRRMLTDAQQGFLNSNAAKVLQGVEIGANVAASGGFGNFGMKEDEIETYGFGEDALNVESSQQDFHIKVEGGEYVKEPGKDGYKVPANKTHANGDTLAAQGTKIFSDRKEMEIEGETPAVRAERRDRNLAKIKKNLEKNPLDAINNKTYERAVKNAEAEEARDLEYQEALKKTFEAQEATKEVDSIKKKIPEFKWGEDELGNPVWIPDEGPMAGGFASTEMDTPDFNQNTEAVTPYAGELRNKPLQTSLSPSGGNPNLGSDITLKGADNVLERSQTSQQNPAQYDPKSFASIISPTPTTDAGISQMTADATETGGATRNPEDRIEINAILKKYMGGKGKGNIDTSQMTAGNVAGLAGIVQNSFAADKYADLNRAATQDPKNSFLNVGKRGENLLDSTRSNLSALKTKAERDLESARKTTTATLDSQASSINTKRAGQIAAERQLQKSKVDLDAGFAAQMMGLDSNLAQLMNQSDIQRAQGEQLRADTESANVDAYYTAKGRAAQHKGEALIQGGRALNQMKYAGTTSQLIKELMATGMEEEQAKMYARAIVQASGQNVTSTQTDK